MGPEIFLIDFENVQPAGVGQLKPGDCRIKVFLGQNQSKAPVELVRALQPFGSDAEYLTISGSGPNAVDFHIAFYIGRLAGQHAGARFTIVSRDTGFDPLVRHVSALGIRCRRIAALRGDALVAKVSAVGKAKKPAAPTKPDELKKRPPTIALASAVPAKGAVTKTAAAKRVAPTRSKNVHVTVLPDASAKPAPKGTPGTSSEMAVIIENALTRLKGLKAAKPTRLKTLESSVASWSEPPLDAPKVALVLAELTHRKLIAIDGNKVVYRLK